MRAGFVGGDDRRAALAGHRPHDLGGERAVGDRACARR
jgi:hypothetical protein